MSNDQVAAASFQFTIRSLFLWTAIVAGVFLGFRAISNSYYWQLNDTYDVLLLHPEVVDVQIEGNDDVYYEVEIIRFSLKHEPSKRREVMIPHGAGKNEIRRCIERTLEASIGSAAGKTD